MGGGSQSPKILSALIFSLRYLLHHQLGSPVGWHTLGPKPITKDDNLALVAESTQKHFVTCTQTNLCSLDSIYSTGSGLTWWWVFLLIQLSVHSQYISYFSAFGRHFYEYALSIYISAKHSSDHVSYYVFFVITEDRQLFVF